MFADGPRLRPFVANQYEADRQREGTQPLESRETFLQPQSTQKYGDK
jgi:hypothetical protein